MSEHLVSTAAAAGAPLAEFPNTACARAAAAICQRYSMPSLAAHSVRSYLWGAEYATQHGLSFDLELFFVSAMVHDLGLSATFDAHRTSFEIVGGELGRTLCLGAGWPEERAARVSEVCILHMRDDVAADVDVEAHLLQVGTSADVSGAGAMDFSAEFREALFAAYPRSGFPDEFVAAFRAEAARKPDCAVAVLMASSWPERMRNNSLPR